MRENAARFTKRWFPLQVKGEAARQASGDHRSEDVQDRDVPLEDGAAVPDQDQPTAEEAIGAVEEVHALIHEAGLSRRQREVALAVAEGKTEADAARELGISAADARKHFMRAKPRLRDAARRRGLAP